VRTLSSFPVADLPGHDQRPDPGNAATPAELIVALRQFRLWAGNPSFRTMAARCDQRAAASTMCTLLRAATIPARLEMVDAIVTGCGGSEEDRQRFATAWRRLARNRQL
jgi:hypothetical protein